MSDTPASKADVNADSQNAALEAEVRTALAAVQDRYAEASISPAIKSLRINGAAAGVELDFGYPLGSYKAELEAQVKAAVEAVAGIDTALVFINQKIKSHAVQSGLKPLQNIKNIIAVASGKGGVGKSTTAVNLALALAADGASVGMLDADIYGPSQPQMLGIDARATSKDQKSIEPLENHGVKAMSIGFLVDSKEPTIWRGPMVTQALHQLLNDTNWGQLDYLIIDMPPGTGDTQLSLSQKIPVSGAVIITTPQDISLLDARKGLKMFSKVNVNVLGVIENMSTHICSSCGHEEAIFGSGGGQQLAGEENVTLLGQLPLHIKIREQADSGLPTVVADPDGDLAGRYRDIGRRMTARLAGASRNYQAVFPNIVVENN